MKTKGILHDKSQAVKLLEMMTDTLLMVKNDGTCVDMIVKTPDNPYVNRELTLLGRNLFEYFPTETVRELRPAMESVAHTGIASNANYDLPSPDRMYYFKCIIQKYDDDHLLLVYRDITQRSQMKLSLQLANERLKETGKAARISYWNYTPSTGKFYYYGYVGLLVNAGEEMEITLDQFLTNVYPDDREKLVSYLNDPETRHRTYDYRVVKDGRAYYMRTKILNRYHLRNGELIIDGYTQNIDDIVSNWDRLNMIITAVNNSYETIFAAKADGTLVFVNQLCRKMNHIPVDVDITGYKIYELMANFRGEEKWVQFLDSLRASNNTIKYTCRHPYAEFNVINTEYYSFVVQNEYGEDIIWFLGHDISEFTRYERRLKEAKERAEESDRLKSAFLSNMSHEIRTPLNAIVGFSAIMADIESREERRRFQEIIESNNKRLLMLINEVLDLSRIESGTLVFNFSAVSMNDLCREIINTYQLYAGRIRLELEIPDHDSTIRSDRNRLIQVLANLVDNAIKFTPNGTITIGYRVHGDWIELYVRDTGIGIPEDKLEKVFERFVKVDSFAQGTGLGLSICKTILERLGGNITVASRLGEGATFTCRIPLIIVDLEEQLFESRSESQLLNQPDEIKATILVAEDIDDNFELIHAMIGNRYRLLHARNGREAVEIFLSEQPSLILMDVRMPEMDGIEAMQEIRQRSPFYPPIVAVSAYMLDLDKELLLDKGCQDILGKPFDKELLLATIGKFL